MAQAEPKYVPVTPDVGGGGSSNNLSATVSSSVTDIVEASWSTDCSPADNFVNFRLDSDNYLSNIKPYLYPRSTYWTFKIDPKPFGNTENDLSKFLSLYRIPIPDNWNGEEITTFSRLYPPASWKSPWPEYIPIMKTIYNNYKLNYAVKYYDNDLGKNCWLCPGYIRPGTVPLLNGEDANNRFTLVYEKNKEGSPITAFDEETVQERECDTYDRHRSFDYYSEYRLKRSDAELILEQRTKETRGGRDVWKLIKKLEATEFADKAVPRYFFIQVQGGGGGGAGKFNMTNELYNIHTAKPGVGGGGGGYVSSLVDMTQKDYNVLYFFVGRGGEAGHSFNFNLNDSWDYVADTYEDANKKEWNTKYGTYYPAQPAGEYIPRDFFSGEDGCSSEVGTLVSKGEGNLMFAAGGKGGGWSISHEAKPLHWQPTGGTGGWASSSITTDYGVSKNGGNGGSYHTIYNSNQGTTSYRSASGVSSTKVTIERFTSDVVGKYGPAISTAASSGGASTHSDSTGYGYGGGGSSLGNGADYITNSSSIYNAGPLSTAGSGYGSGGGGEKNIYSRTVQSYAYAGREGVIVINW